MSFVIYRQSIFRPHKLIFGLKFYDEIDDNGKLQLRLFVLGYMKPTKCNNCIHIAIVLRSAKINIRRNSKTNQKKWYTAYAEHSGIINSWSSQQKFRGSDYATNDLLKQKMSQSIYRF